MSRHLARLIVLSTLCAGAACTETPSSPSRLSAELSDAFLTVPYSFSSAQSSFDVTLGDSQSPWMPTFGGPGPGMGPGMMGGAMGGAMGGHGPGFDTMMGGGMQADFVGGHGFGRGFGHGPFGDPHLLGVCGTPTFSAATGRVTCATETHGGITVTRSIAFTDASGKAQPTFDSVTTDAVDTRIQVSGSIIRRDSGTTTVNHASDRMVSGLARGSTKHTVNGTSVGHESTAGARTRDGKTFTAMRDVADTTRGLVIPVQTTATPAYPIAGTVIRVMSATVTVAGSSAQTSSRREVVTYDGSATAKLVITHDGTTKTCALPLPFGKPTCQ